MASFGEGHENWQSFISLWAMAGVRDLSIWYPSQGFTPDTIRPYPPTISFDNNGANLLNLRLYNSYNGILGRFSSGHTVGDLSGTVLNAGILVGNGYASSYLYNVRLETTRGKHNRRPDPRRSRERR